MAKHGFDHYLNIAEESHTKTASAGKVSMLSLNKLAAELSGSAAAEALAGAKPAEATVAGANPGVVADTEAATAAALLLAGQNAEVVARGEMPAAAKPTQLIVSDAAGMVTDAQHLNKTPEAVAEAAEPTSKTAELARAKEIGETMAAAFLGTFEKQAAEREFNEAVEYLQSRGVLDGYELTNK